MVQKIIKEDGANVELRIEPGNDVIHLTVGDLNDRYYGGIILEKDDILGLIDMLLENYKMIK